MALDVVTGAFSYTGCFIASELLGRGRAVRTLSRRPPPPGHPLADRVETADLQFDDRAALTAALEGAETLYNTFWIRFPHAGRTFEWAVAASATLFGCARAAGVSHIVHVSVSNASAGSRYAYFRGKAQVEADLARCGIPHTVLRPTLVFGGRQEILINNMAWLLRHLPVFLLPGGGACRIQPVAVEDVARLAADAAAAGGAGTLDAAGPEIVTCAEMLAAIRSVVRGRARVVSVPAAWVPPLCRLAGLPLRDRLLTAEELGALIDELLVSAGPPTGTRRFSEWLPDQAGWLGRSYANELARNWR
ncbi:MAG: SDR family oxidoreductase [Gaiellales bacterium]